MMLKSFIPILFLLIVATSRAFSQYDGLPDFTELSLVPCSKVSIETPPSRSPFISMPFSNILVVDARYDTTNFGYFHARGTGEILKVCPTTTLTAEVTALFKNYFNGSWKIEGDTLLVQIKKCWVRNYDALYRDTEGRRVKNGIDLNLEFYLRKGSCNYPLYRFDSIVVMHGRSSEIAGKILSKGLIASVEKLKKLNYNDITRRKCISPSQIDSFNYIHNNLPILSQKVARKGVYLTITEFKNNTPSFVEFSVDIKPTADMIYIEGKKIEDSLITDALIFSDGKEMFARVGPNFVPLYKCGDNFEFYGIREEGRAYRNYSGVDPTAGPQSMAGLGNALGSALAERMSRESTFSTTELWMIDLDEGKIVNPLQSYYSSLQSP